MDYFSLREEQGVTVVSFEFDEITIQQREELKGKLARLLGGGARNFVFNLSRLGFFSSLAITTLVFFAKEARQKGGEIKLCELTREAKDIMNITHIDKIFESYDTESGAVQSYVK